MDIDSNCPYLLPVFGETTSHLTSKLNVMDGRTDRRGVSIFLMLTKNSTPPNYFLYTIFFFMLEIAWNAKKTFNI